MHIVSAVRLQRSQVNLKKLLPSLEFVEMGVVVNFRGSELDSFVIEVDDALLKGLLSQRSFL